MQTLEIKASKKTTTKASINLAAAIDLEAAAGTDKPATFQMDLYGGGTLRLPGWDRPVVIDISGMAHGGRVPILADHDNRLESQLGDGEVEATGNAVTVRGRLARGTELVEHLVRLTAAGVAVQASIGASVERIEFIKAGESVQVNGRTFQGPIYVARKTTIREASVVPAGADASSSVRVAATASDVDTDSDDPSPSDPATRERERIRAGLASIDRHESDLGDRAASIRAAFLAGDIDSRELDARLLSAIRAARPSAPAVILGAGRGGRRINSPAVIEAATLAYLGRPDVAEKALGAEVTQRASEMRASCILDIAAAALRLEGRETPHSRDEMIRAAFSTISLPLALSNSAGKIAYDAYQDVPATWRAFARRQSLNNFHEVDIIRTHLDGRFEDIGPAGEIKHGTVGEQGNKIRLGTSGVMLAITRRDLINDNLGVFAGNAAAMGSAAARRISDDVWTLIMADDGEFWAVENGNYISGADSALTVDGLSAAVSKLRKQVDPTGKPIGLTPTTLVVAPELETQARALLDSVDFQHTSDSSGPTGNPVRGIAKLEVEPRLSSAAFTGNSAKAWYLFARPSDGPIIVGFLDGRETPTVETENTNFNTLGMQIRAYIDHGVALGDHRASVKSKGEA